MGSSASAKMEHWEIRAVLGERFNVGWQLSKADKNIRKHVGIGFREAMTVLDDDHAINEEQAEDGEAREKLVGRSNAGRLLAVVVSIHWPSAEEGAEEMGFIRIVSARLATPAERSLYPA